MNNDNISLVFKIVKPLLCLVLGYYLFDVSIHSLLQLTQSAEYVDQLHIEPFFNTCVTGGAGLALMLYTGLSVIFKVVYYCYGLFICLIELMHNAIVSAVKRLHQKKKDDE